MDETAWTDPRYARLVEEWDRLRGRRAHRRSAGFCPGCLHGLGTIMMVDLTTREPIMVPCSRCPAE